MCVLATALMLTLTLTPNPLATASETRIQGRLNGSVALTCNTSRDHNITFMYLQKDGVFVNGFYVGTELKGAWKNTLLKDTTIHIFNLNISHSGSYTCYTKYNDLNQVDSSVIKLSVIAPYSTPSVLKTCEKHCRVTCSSHGGFPATMVRWKVWTEAGNVLQDWREENNSKDSDPDSHLVNISSQALFNCSSGAQMFFSCSVDGLHTSNFSVCDPQRQNGILTEVLLSVLLLVVVAVIGGLCVWGCLRAESGKSKVPTEEMTSLSNKIAKQPVQWPTEDEEVAHRG